MNVGDSIRLSILDWERGELDSAMLHACNSVDGTAKKQFPSLGSNARFTRLLRDNYSILGPMGMPGINVDETRFAIKVERPKATGGFPDLADIIYGIHRCSHGHGDELPDGFELLRDAAGSPDRTRIHLEKGKIRISDRIIFALLAVSVLSPTNVGQSVPKGFILTLGTDIFQINEWWGRREDFGRHVATLNLPSVKLDFGDWYHNP